MAGEPQYPKDASVGAGANDGAGGSEGSPPASGEAATAAAAARAADPRRNKHLMAGAAIGIGSAAIVAALLYANRGRKGPRDEG